MYEDNTEGERVVIGIALMVMGVFLIGYIGWALTVIIPHLL